MADPRTASFDVRLAESPLEIEAAQRLRYQVFYEELGALPTLEIRRTGIDVDPYDYCCDHLLVVDRRRSNGLPFVVGTYRLMRKNAALMNGGFYSAQEYDLDPLVRYPADIVEVGRSCVHADYRRGAVMPLLWRGIAEYVAERGIELIFGCASFPGTTDADALGRELSYLHHHHLAPAEFRPRALEHRYVGMTRVPPDGVDADAALGALPPLVKGYIRLGGFVGDGAVIDYDFRTVDVCVVVKTDRLTEKYQRHYRPSGRAWAKRPSPA